MGNRPGPPAGQHHVAQSFEPKQTPRKESEVAIATQRMRNAAAFMRTQQKVARERRSPVQRPK